ncbi:hypothetical protein [Streptomyces noursei]|nr:hypothetical protein [Streptomyces noursei]AIA05387.1 hypothetical protein DC74_4915 [Streptomyces noursei]
MSDVLLLLAVIALTLAIVGRTVWFLLTMAVGLAAVRRSRR